MLVRIRGCKSIGVRALKRSGKGGHQRERIEVHAWCKEFLVDLDTMVRKSYILYFRFGDLSDSMCFYFTVFD